MILLYPTCRLVQTDVLWNNCGCGLPLEDTFMPISSLEAINRINEQVTVEMLVRATKNCQRCSLMFLDSEKDHHDPKNFAVAVTESGRANFKQAKIGDPALYFKGKTIRVTGTVMVKDEQPQI